MMMANHNPLFPPEFPMPEQPGTPPPVSNSPPVPIVFERDQPEGLTLRVYAAIMLRVPESGINWLDQMIARSRELDQHKE